MVYTTRTLVKIAGFGGFFLLSSVVGMRYYTIKRFQQAPYYQQAVRIVLENQAVSDYMGKPLHFGNPDFADNSVNCSTPEFAKFVIPIKGANRKGKIHLTANYTPLQIKTDDNSLEISEPGANIIKSERIRNDIEGRRTGERWKLERLELSLDDKPDRKLDLLLLSGLTNVVNH